GADSTDVVCRLRSRAVLDSSTLSHRTEARLCFGVRRLAAAFAPAELARAEKREQAPALHGACSAKRLIVNNAPVPHPQHAVGHCCRFGIMRDHQGSLPE